ncbi:MAG TPA: hypothetical protein VFR25_02465 [Candidatus Eisenbacteria bacterium]|nr:hypothetical protein [Candidatus Eisenbacteria bacterium]
MRLALFIVTATLVVAAEGHAATAPPPRADVLYNAGTAALDKGDVGPAVAFLTAAARLEPRARDIQINLKQATVAAARARGVESQDEIEVPREVPLSTAEIAWVGAILLLVGAALGIASRVTRLPRTLGIAAVLVVAVGAAIHVWLVARAHAEAVHPEAVVVVPQLAVERGPDEPSRAPVVLGAGERVHLGPTRGGQVEIRIAGAAIGWAPHEGLWRVQETPRYTARYATP